MKLSCPSQVIGITDQIRTWSMSRTVQLSTGMPSKLFREVGWKSPMKRRDSREMRFQSVVNRLEFEMHKLLQDASAS